MDLLETQLVSPQLDTLDNGHYKYFFFLSLVPVYFDIERSLPCVG